MLDRTASPSWDYIPVREVMNPDPVTVSPKMKLNHAASLMQERDVSCLIVTRKDEPMGSLSERDIIRLVVAKDLKPNQVTVKEVMTSPVHSVGPDEDLTSVARAMSKAKTRIMAVVEDRRLIGIITQRDLFNLSPTLLELSREYARISNNGMTGEARSSGYCDMCNAYSDELEDADGMMVCKDCHR